LVGAPREALPTTDEGEFYWSDLIGLDVINAMLKNAWARWPV
jgi:16S rRNA processing protein RimM